MKKLAIIRSDNSPHQCPFGLSIKNGCMNAGDSVLKMTPLHLIAEKDKEFQLQHNVAVYALNGEGRCVYADQLIEKTDVVNCDFGDSGAGMQSVSVPATEGFSFVGGPFAITHYSAFPLETYWEQYTESDSHSKIYGYASLDSRKTLQKQVNSLLEAIVEQESK